MINNFINSNNDITWKYKGSVTGSTKMDMPTGTWRELKIVVSVAGTVETFDKYITKLELDTILASSSKAYYTGFNPGSQTWFKMAINSGTGITMQNLVWFGDNNLSTSKLYLFYR